MHTILLCCVLSRMFMVAGSAADVMTTHRGLRIPGTYEANPIARAVGPGKLILFTDIGAEAAIHATGFQQEFPRMSGTARFIIGGLHFAAAYWNWHEIRKIQRQCFQCP